MCLVLVLTRCPYKYRQCSSFPAHPCFLFWKTKGEQNKRQCVMVTLSSYEVLDHENAKKKNISCPILDRNENFKNLRRSWGLNRDLFLSDLFYSRVVFLESNSTNDAAEFWMYIKRISGCMVLCSLPPVKTIYKYVLVDSSQWTYCSEHFLHVYKLNMLRKGQVPTNLDSICFLCVCVCVFCSG